MKQGLTQGLVTGLLSGLNARASGGEVIIPATAEVGDQTPNAFFPIDPDAVATLLGNVAAVPSYIFTCQEPSGNLVCSLTGEQLVQAPIFGDGPTMGVATAGLNGAARTAIRLVEAGDTSFVATRSSLLDPADGSIAWVAFIKVPTDDGNYTPFSKGTGLTGAAPEERAGFSQYLSPTGLLGCNTSDGTTSASVALAGTDICDDTWRPVALVYNDVADTILIAHNSASNSQSTSALTFPASKSYFSIGAGRYKAPPMDVTYLALFEGAAARAVTQAGIASWRTAAVE